ncbi:proline--tRNA ligase [candidate division KSB1 bacterium]
MAEKITKQGNDFSRWYNDVVIRAELADYSPVRGCMVIRPNGFAIWEKLRDILDKLIKETGHQNAYFPLLIPENFFRKEAEHVKGFSPECAVVTHGGGKKLEEPLMIRPTSETIIYSMYSKWINSYRDLPVLINQWANIVRWEMRTRLFLRTTEFLWQEGHTAHATYEEAEEECLKMLDVYAEFAEKYMAMSVIKGQKSEKEKFAGALRTYSIESMMKDKKSLQSGTSHNLGQNFAKAFNVRYQTKNGNMNYVWQTSWGVSTRLIGALIMAHGDDNGLIIPPKIAPTQVVIIPIKGEDEENTEINNIIDKINNDIKKEISVKVDDDEKTSPGWKFNQYELLGVPLRIEIGPKDIKNKEVVLVRRDNKKKERIPWDNIKEKLKVVLDSIQDNIFKKACELRKENTLYPNDYDKFKEILESDGGFLMSHWCGKTECEEKIQEETKAVICSIPLDSKNEQGRCVLCGKDSKKRVLFAKTY